MAQEQDQMTQRKGKKQGPPVPPGYQYQTPAGPPKPPAQTKKSNKPPINKNGNTGFQTPQMSDVPAATSTGPAGEQYPTPAGPPVPPGYQYANPAGPAKPKFKPPVNPYAPGWANAPAFQNSQANFQTPQYSSMPMAPNIPGWMKKPPIDPVTGQYVGNVWYGNDFGNNAGAPMSTAGYYTGWTGNASNAPAPTTPTTPSLPSTGKKKGYYTPTKKRGGGGGGGGRGYGGNSNGNEWAYTMTRWNIG